MTEDQGTVDASEYGDYYDTTSDIGSPCNNGNTKAFSEVFLPTLYSLVFIIGFIGNGLVVWVLIRYRQKSNMTDVCLFNLALSDLLFLVSLPFWAHSAMDAWIFGNFMCHFITGLFTLGQYGSIFFIVLMTLDRYVVIVHAHSIFSRNRSVKMGLVLASFVWMLSLFVSLPNIIFAKAKNEQNIKVSCKSEFPENTAWMSFTYLKMNLLTLVIPLIIMSYCYSQIIPTLLSIKSQKRHKVVKLILAVVAVYFLFWTPYNIVMFLMYLQKHEYLVACKWQTSLSLAMQWVETIAFCHCCLNPIIYAFAGQKFRRAVLKVLKEQFPLCFSQCATFSLQLSERRSSVFSKSTEYSSTQIA
ncbi:C-C chemokine receptor type 5-like isoform X3 [Carassius auratus]|uniref:C-C chemokine receptor type 5-like isoform X3 n=1 Tax=Carassius auratus TaxID=7957 RepID=A0A6P6PLD3_CARAU|nr:C-C chemokine receptor type 5-like isoform X3 [Carassius auratus]XP_052475011.1 C-C chemokine receptor type 5 isoform X2 [Carassius gibelio]